MHSVYLLTNTINGAVYVGKTSTTFEARQYDHLKRLRGGYHENSHLQNAWKLYGEEVFVWDVIALADTSEQANDLEIFYIAHYREKGITVYNHRAGGDGGLHSEETKEKIRQGQYNRPPDTEETRRKRSVAQTGKKATEETRKKLSEIRKGKPKPAFSEEHRRKIGENSKARGCSEETKEKISASSKGKPKSEEWKAKMRATRASKFWSSGRKKAAGPAQPSLEM